jgi:fatty-acyl-CoA synthase
VKEATVFGIPHDHWGEIPKAYVVLKPDVLITEKELILYCKEKIAHYKVHNKTFESTLLSR